MKLAFTPPKAIDAWVTRVANSKNPARDKSLNVRSIRSYYSERPVISARWSKYIHGRWGHYADRESVQISANPTTKPRHAINAEGAKLYEFAELLGRYNEGLFWVNYDACGRSHSSYKHRLVNSIYAHGHNAVFVDQHLMEANPHKRSAAFFTMFDDRMADMLLLSELEYADGIMKEREYFAAAHGLALPPLREDVVAKMVEYKLAA